MNQGNARQLWNDMCNPSVGVAQGEEVSEATVLKGAAMALEVPVWLSHLSPLEGMDKQVADFLRQWADDIEGIKRDEPEVEPPLVKVKVPTTEQRAAWVTHMATSQSTYGPRELTELLCDALAGKFDDRIRQWLSE